MKCIAKFQKVRCNRDCTFLYCNEHWGGKKRKVVAIWAFLAVIFTAISYKETICGWFMTKHEKFIEDKYIYIPPILTNFDVTKEVHINWGGGSSTRDFSNQELEISDEEITIGCMGNDATGTLSLDKGFSYILKVKKNLLTLSLSVKDYTGKSLADIKDNVGSIDKYKIKNYDATSDHIEILDEYGNVAFCLWVEENNTIQIRGYFVGTMCATFCNGPVTRFVNKNDPQYLEKCTIYAQELKPKFVK